MSKSKQKKIERLESIVVGAGFLLQTLKAKHGHEFSEGTSEQVNQCLRDCKQVQTSVLERTRRQMEQANDHTDE